ncbi:MAG TPA: adenylate/guanylate cyclase domain-containing protein [Acidimicrobiales bacterium]|nr:adenylate/guanylate cyclase domain-containing protein [Acidimicrobiales bacterium]
MSDETPGAAGAGTDLREVRAQLLAAGCTPEELDRAERDGTLPLLAVERLLVDEPAVHDLEDVARRTGLRPDQVQHLWRSLGYPVPRPGELAFTDTDVELLAEVSRAVAGDVAPTELVLQMSRVIGSSMARIAAAQVDVISAGAAGEPRPGVLGDTEVTDDRIVRAARALLPIVPRVLAVAWRRHLQAAARRRLTLAEAGGGQLGVVGFADMVGFTALSQQLTRDELAGVVDQFERLTFDVVTAHGGRVVKMIGDEVMFTVDAPRAAAEIALALVEGGRRDDQVSDMRVGLAYGPLIEREGDLYGPVVNLASRITAIAFPGTVVVDAGLREHLAGDPGYVLRTMRPRYLKDIGRVKLWVLRRAGPPEDRFAARRRALREAVSARVEPGDDDAAAG